MSIDIEKLLEDLKFDADMLDDLGDSQEDNLTVRSIGAIRQLQERLRTADEKIRELEDWKERWLPKIQSAHFRGQI